MPMNNFNTGRDIVLTIVGFDNTVHPFGLLTQFDARQMTNKVTIKGIDGIIRYLEIPDGWDGTFAYERQDSQLDDYFCNLEATYYAGTNIPASIITETITNPDQSISQYRFTGVMIKYDDAGTWKGDAGVPVRMSWCASRRLKVQ